MVRCLIAPRPTLQPAVNNGLPVATCNGTLTTAIVMSKTLAFFFMQVPAPPFTTIAYVRATITLLKLWSTKSSPHYSSLHRGNIQAPI
jgi:hypothetical protein